VRIVAAAIGQWQQYPEKWSGCRVLNMGGPERLSRVDMAHKVNVLHVVTTGCKTWLLLSQTKALPSAEPLSTPSLAPLKLLTKYLPCPSWLPGG
jgi:hypothetical protein